MTFLLPPIGSLQRVLLVAILAPALFVALAVAFPALAVLPFLNDGTDRAVRLLRAHNAYLRALLTTRRPRGEANSRAPDGPVASGTPTPS
ncbi:dTMP kinase [Streptomyces phytophilus]|uniref:dTMP kinase n=1 Tax=Streptomyces phytophilus TaxID=722715 RepID=UPI0015F0D1E3|nr:dTMP kinase [Streptomyces phytophilus]